VGCRENPECADSRQGVSAPPPRNMTKIVYVPTVEGLHFVRGKSGSRYRDHEAFDVFNVMTVDAEYEPQRFRPVPDFGPGTELSLMLPPSDCGECLRLKMVMDAMGGDWCSENVESLADGMMENAEQLGGVSLVEAIKLWRLAVNGPRVPLTQSGVAKALILEACSRADLYRN